MLVDQLSTLYSSSDLEIAIAIWELILLTITGATTIFFVRSLLKLKFIKQSSGWALRKRKDRMACQHPFIRNIGQW